MSGVDDIRVRGKKIAKGAGRKNETFMLGMIGIDPGGTTGVAWGVWDRKQHGELGWLAALRDLEFAGEAEVSGDELAQARELDRMARTFAEEIRIAGRDRGLNHADIRFMILMESFTLRVGSGAKGGGVKSGARAGLAPVRVAAAFEGLRVGRLVEAIEAGAVGRDTKIIRVTYQQASDAKYVVTDARLRASGRWIRGSTHKRDAWRHVGLGMKRWLDSQS